eukprot:1479714-Pleurochrysis_carterae.AAC.1
MLPPTGDLDAGAEHVRSMCFFLTVYACADAASDYPHRSIVHGTYCDVRSARGYSWHARVRTEGVLVAVRAYPCSVRLCAEHVRSLGGACADPDG